jgi:hypothetical protein
MRARRFIALVQREITRVNSITLRYPLELIVSIFTFATVFAAIYWVVNLANLPLDMFRGGVAPVATRYALWIIVTTATSTAAYHMMTESTQTRAAIFCIKSPWMQILISRQIAHSIQGIAVALLLLAPLLVFSDQIPNLIICLLIALSIICALPACWGIGVALCGLAARFKRIGALLVPVNFGLMFAVMSPQSVVRPTFELLPFTASAYVTSSVAAGTLNPQEALKLLAHILPGSVVVFIVGLLIGHALIDAAKNANTL